MAYYSLAFLIIFTIVSDRNFCSKSKEKISVRDKNQVNMKKFIEQLGNVNWSQLESYDDPNNSYKSFLAKYTEIYNNCFPVRRIKANHHNIDKPWLSKDLLRSIKMKNKLYRRTFQ